MHPGSLVFPFPSKLRWSRPRKPEYRKKNKSTNEEKKGDESNEKEWVDDMVILKAIDQKKCLKEKDPASLKHPLPFHERTQHFLPDQDNPLLTLVRDLQYFA